MDTKVMKLIATWNQAIEVGQEFDIHTDDGDYVETVSILAIYSVTSHPEVICLVAKGRISRI
jgi:hypothetical protein